MRLAIGAVLAVGVVTAGMIIAAAVLPVYVSVIILCFSVLGVAIWYARSWMVRQRHRDGELAEQWDNFQLAVRDNPNAYPCQVTNPYQCSATGTKAIITWIQTNREQDSWFEDDWPEPGEYLLVTGRIGYGPHNNDPNVFFVDQVLRSAPPDALDTWRRRRRDGPQDSDPTS